MRRTPRDSDVNLPKPSSPNELHKDLETFLEKVWKDAANKKLYREAIKKTTYPDKDHRLLQNVYNIYSPPPPNVGETENPPWIFSGVYHNIEPSKVQQRVYVSVKAEHVKTVWNALQGFLCGYGGAWNAKHATDEEAKSRPDTIVIYLKGKKDVSIILTFIRGLMYEKTLTKDMFKTAIPPTTKAAKGLVGVASAAQPLEDGWAAVQKAHHEQSFGMQLAQFATKAYVHVRESKDGDLEKFKARAAEEFHEAGINPRTPWKYNLDQEQRDELTRRHKVAMKTHGVDNSGLRGRGAGASKLTRQDDTKKPKTNKGKRGGNR